MNCNLVTKLKIKCFNSLFCYRAADLFNQHTKYVCSSFHARSSSWGFIFYCLSTYCCLDVFFKKNQLFLSTACKPNRDKRNVVRCYSAFLWRYCGEELGTMAHSTLLPPENPPQILSTSHRQNLSCASKDLFPKDTLGRRGAHPWSGAEAESSPRLCPSWCRCLKLDKGCRGCLLLAGTSCQMAAQSPLLIYWCCVPRKLNTA